MAALKMTTLAGELDNGNASRWVRNRSATKTRPAMDVTHATPLSATSVRLFNGFDS
jgi:hypothetical protein